MSSGSGIFYYRLRIIDPISGCSEPSSNVITITVIADPTTSIAVNNQSICVGGSALITSSVTPGSGVYAYQWETATSGAGPWSAIGGATNATYNVPSVTAGVRFYRLQVTDNLNGCADPISNTVSVTVNPVPSISVAPVQPVCLGSSVVLVSIATNGTGGFTYQWQTAE